MTKAELIAKIESLDSYDADSDGIYSPPCDIGTYVMREEVLDACNELAE